jgi:threonine dehydratase
MADLMLTRDDILSAVKTIAGHVRTTPVIAMERGAWGCQGNIVIKLEQSQHTGSFKVRGAFNRLLSVSVPESGVVAASGGNHGAAVTYAARKLGYPAAIFVPEISSRLKVDRLRTLGAQVAVVGANIAEALMASEEYARQTGALVVHPYDQKDIVAGQGTIAYEFEQQCADLDTILVAVGGGGLIGGIASWFQHDRRVIGVESKQTAAMYSALDAGYPVDVEVGGLAADALGARRVGQYGFAAVHEYVERVILVDDQDIQAAQKLLWSDLRMIAEPAGATALAALLGKYYQPAADERVGIIICGGNAQFEQVQ